MSKQSLMQIALGDQWQQLPIVLQAHYQYKANTDTGCLDINYPVYMQPYLTFLRLFGALINRRGKNIPTTVEKHMQGNIQYWKRTIRFDQNKIIYFKSFWVHQSKNELIEFVNPFLGLRMSVHVQNSKLYYEGQNIVIKLGKLLIPIPEWLVLGHTTIVETAISDCEFKMDFRLKHPLFGELFCYSGEFKNVL
jgi:hypothetical protein